MIVCPACHAENPDGTKICVKCATELPKVAPVKVKPAETETKKYGVRDFWRDLVDIVWLFLIVLLILAGFIGEATHWTFKFTETESPIVQAPVVSPVVHKHMGRHIGVSSMETEKPVVEYGNPETFYNKGKKEYDQKNYQASFNYLKQALMVDPTFAKAYFGLGYLYSRFDMDDPAVRMYEMALRFDPNHVDSINNLGMMYYHAGNFDDAMDLFQKAVTLDNQNADYQYNLGSLYLDKGQPQDALVAFQKAANLRPDDASIYNNLALTYEKLGNKQEAEDAWKKVLLYAKDADLLKQAKTHLSFLSNQT